MKQQYILGQDIEKHLVRTVSRMMTPDLPNLKTAKVPTVTFSRHML